MEQIRKIKLSKKTVIIIALIGISLMLIGNGGSSDNKNISDSDEVHLEKILSDIEGVGKVKMMLSKKESKSSFYSDKDSCEYLGAVVVAEGGNINEVKQKIIRAVKAITGLDSHKIVIFRLSDD